MLHRAYRRSPRNLAATTPRGSLTDRQRADAIVRTIGDAAPPPPRRRHYANADNGLHVSVRSNRNREEVMEALRAKAGGATLVEYWHNGGEATEATLSRQPHRLPVERYRMAMLAAPRPGGAPAGSPSTTHATLQPLLALLQAQAAQPGPAGQQAILTMAPLVTMMAQADTAQPESGVRITDRVDRYLSYLEQRETSRLATDGALYTLYLFVGINGNLLLRDISRSHCDRFLEALKHWPRNASKRRSYRDMSVKAAIQKAERDGDQPIDQGTQQSHVERLRSFFLWCESRDEVRPNLLFRVRVNPKKRNKDRKQHRRPYSVDELKLIFSPERVARATKPFQFWMPVLGYYTGARINELAQLYVDDIIHVNGRWLLSIGMDRDGQRIKTLAARRLIPLHPHLIELGFLRFVQQAKAWQRGRLFPDVVWGRNGPGETVSRWYAALIKELEIDGHQTFHAYRNTFVYHASRSGILQEHYSELTGHAVNGSNVITDFYLLEQDAAERCALFDRIQFRPIEHPPYHPTAFDGVFRRAHVVAQHEERLREAFGDGEEGV